MAFPLEHRRPLRRVGRWAVALGALAAGVSVATPCATAAAQASARAEPWLWPTAAPHRLLRGFEAPPTRYSVGHRGIDIATSAGSNVVAPADGDVHFSGRVVDRPVITLDVGDGLLVSIEPVEASVAVGTPVEAGEGIGVVGRGGHCDARCIHLGVRLNGEYISPLLHLGGIERAVLLPLSAGTG